MSQTLRTLLACALLVCASAQKAQQLHGLQRSPAYPHSFGQLRGVDFLAKMEHKERALAVASATMCLDPSACTNVDGTRAVSQPCK